MMNTTLVAAGPAKKPAARPHKSKALKRSLYTDEQKAELFKNLLGHLYRLSDKDALAALENQKVQELQKAFAGKIDDGGLDYFPLQIAL